MRTELEKVDVLAIGAHPDDVEIGASGTVARLVSQGRSVGLLDLTRGELGSRGTPEVRQAEALKSAQVLGVRFRANLGLPDGRLQPDIPSREILARALRVARPSIILAPGSERRHPDHAAAGVLAREASWIAGLVAYGLAGEAHKCQRVLFYSLHEDVEPAFVVDISTHWDTKRKALECFASQFMSGQGAKTLISSPDFLPWIEARARVVGRLAGCELGEAFSMFGVPAVDDLFQLFGEGRR
ncbi:MAG: bacillithiol biosynthesis deacetylase BshB1 [Planctomycetota bacterium]